MLPLHQKKQFNPCLGEGRVDQKKQPNPRLRKGRVDQKKRPNPCLREGSVDQKKQLNPRLGEGRLDEMGDELRRFRCCVLKDVFFASCKISSRPPQLYLLANAMTDEIIKIDAFEYYTKTFVMLVPT